MNQSEDNNLKKQWQDAFRKEEEAPPPFIWQAIENRLDEKSVEESSTANWWKPSTLYYYGVAACAMIACLVGGYMLYNAPGSSTHLLSTMTGSSDSAVVHTETHNEVLAITENKYKESIDPVEVPIISQRSSMADNRRTSSSESAQSLSDLVISNVGSDHSNTTAIPHLEVEEVVAKVNGGIQQSSSPSLGEIRDIELHELEKQSFVQTQVRFNKRIIFYRPSIAVEEEEARDESVSKEYYAGASMMPALFNPNVGIVSTTMSTAALHNNSNVRQTKMSIPSRQGASWAVQTYGGIKLTKHLSLETGISFLKGNSMFESKGYMMDVMNAKSINALETALASSSNKIAHKIPNYGMMVNQSEYSKNTTTYYMDVKETYQNNYSFIQLPVQAGYTIAPEKKLSYTILGGMVGNLFLQNNLRLTDGGRLRTRVSDRSYQPLHWSASSGLRITYQLNDNWSTMVTGSYQKALLETGSNHNGVEIKPQLFGIGWGIKVNL